METAAASFADTNPAAAIGGRREVGEVRRLHIIYFLTRMGCIQHPHLIRVHHLNPNGVFLRDVKRWMGELRGQDMPDSFSWSYKRRYKTGYVWQDLMDEDLITPISDNEYVLKGSEIFVNRDFGDQDDAACKGTSRTPSSRSSYLTSPSSSSDEKQALHNNEEVEQGKIHHHHNHLEPSSTIKPSNHNHSSPPISLCPSPKLASWAFSNTFYQKQSPVLSSSSGGQLTKLKPRDKQEAPGQPHLTTNKMIINSPTSPTTYASLSSRYSFEQEKLNSNSSSQYINNVGLQKIAPTSQSSSNVSSMSTSPHPLQSPSRSSRSRRSQKHSNPIASRMLRKLMTCGVVNTNDTALVVLSKPSSHTVSNRQSSTRKKQDETQSILSATNHKVVIAETETQLKIRNRNQHDSSSARDDYEGIKGSTKTQRQPARFCRETDACAAYRPVGAPICMQCGKSFRPEKLHLHMTKSCKGTRLPKKYATSPENPDNITQTCESLVLDATSSLPEVFSN